jgi:hypothetical protein
VLAVQDNHALHELAYQRPEFSGWSVHEVMRFVYGWADPAPDPTDREDPTRP